MSMSLTTLEFTGILLAVEFALLAWIGPVLVLRSRRQADTEDDAGAAQLLDEVEQKEPSRRDALTTIFAETYQLEGDELDNTVNEFVAREQSFYQVMTSVYLEREPARLQEIPEELTKVISPWIRMTPKNQVDAAAVSELESEKDALSTELEQTKESMETLMAEYLAAFEKARSLEAEAEAEAAAEVNEEPAAVDATAEDADAAPAQATEEPAAAVDTAAPEEASDADSAAETVAATADEDGAASAGAETDEAVGDGDERAPATPPASIDLAVEDDDEPAADAAAPMFDVSADPDDDEISQDDIDALFANDDEENAAA